MHRMKFADMFMVMHDLMSTRATDDDFKSLLFACGWTPHEYEVRLKSCIDAEEHVRIFQTHSPGRSN